jgi:hypothetical protein
MAGGVFTKKGRRVVKKWKITDLVETFHTPDAYFQ